MKNEFLEWYKKTENKYGQLITPSTGAKLLGITTQHLNRIIQQGRIKRHIFENKTFISRNEVNEEYDRREEVLKKLAPGAEGIVKLINVDKYPEEIITSWLKEASKKDRVKDLENFIKEKHKEWKNLNPGMEFSPKIAPKIYLIAITQDYRNEDKYSFCRIIKDEYKYKFDFE